MTLEPFTGEETLAAPPPRVFGALGDPDSLARILPGLVSAERVDDRTLRATVRPGFSFLRTSLRLTITLEELSPPSEAAYRIAAQGIGVSIQINARVRIEDGAGDTTSRVRWEARVGELTGLIAAVGPSLIRAAADKVIRDGWDALRRNIES